MRHLNPCCMWRLCLFGMVLLAIVSSVRVCVEACMFAHTLFDAGDGEQPTTSALGLDTRRCPHYDLNIL